MKKRITYVMAIVLTIVFFASDAMATDGYFSNGQGTRNKGMAGAGIAFLQSPFSAAMNPAGIGFMEKKWSIEISVAAFNPNRKYNVIGAPTTPDKWGYINADGQFVPDMRFMAFGLSEGTVESGSTLFFIPTIAFTYKIGENNTVAFNFFGNGGMNTDYDAKTYYSAIIDSFGNPMPDGNPNPMANVSKPTGVNLQQMFATLTYSHKFGKHSFGISPMFVYQTIEVKGLEAFRDMGAAGMPGMPVDRSAFVTNNGVSSATGFGVKIGYQGELFTGFRLGASFQPKITMSKFDDYKGLFADEGGFDIPANWQAGISYDINDDMTIAFDVRQILYTGVNSISNPMNPQNMLPLVPDMETTGMKPNPNFVPLGDENGAGFGWEDMMLFKVGAEFRQVENWQFRLGYSYGKQPIQEANVMFNMIAPAVNESHISLGLTRMVGDHAINLAITHALENSVKGVNPFDPAQEIEISMNQWEFEIGFQF